MPKKRQGDFLFSRNSCQKCPQAGMIKRELGIGSDEREGSFFY
ncbi:hypothetical protein BSUBE1_3257 [Bacillus subtilis E1]|nr:hypothetical protein BSSX_0913 [Bacillus subtilis]CCU59888.1 hypothetical protein BSUBE1_3257 [Bacillus subtilis E1]